MSTDFKRSKCHEANNEERDKRSICSDWTTQLTTVRAAMDYGYQVKLVADACATMDLELNGEMIPAEMVQKAFIAALDGVFATII